jgi:hypothetical protein
MTALAIGLADFLLTDEGDVSAFGGAHICQVRRFCHYLFSVSASCEHDAPEVKDGLLPSVNRWMIS